MAQPFGVFDEDARSEGTSSGESAGQDGSDGAVHELNTHTDPTFEPGSATGVAPGVFGAKGTEVEIEASRSLDVTSAAQLVPLLALAPVTLYSLLPFYWIVSIFLPIPWFAFLLLYVAIGAAMFARPVQETFMRALLGFREAGPREREALAPSWAAVCKRANINPEDYSLSIQDSDDINAAAASGRMVAVTSGALRTLPKNELEGILAHELGHHLGLHSVMLIVSYWLSLPVIMLGKAGHAVSRVAYYFTVVFAAFGFPLATVIGLIIGTFFRVIAWALMGAVFIANLVTTWIGKRSEYVADEAAVKLGYGPELSAGLQRLADLGYDTPSTAGVTAHLFSSHPPMSKRLNRIEGVMARIANEEQ